MTIRTYSELILRDDFYARFDYLKLGGKIGVSTFGHDRHVNQRFYSSHEWKRVRDQVIIRDKACDMGTPGWAIHDRVLVHHMNPIMLEDILHFNEDILNPEYLVCVSTSTHNAIHFGDERQLPRPLVERRPGDTTLW